MKKLLSLFILSILALTMFVGCQMPTDGTDSKLEAEETPSYTITVNATNGTASYPKTAKAGEKVTITATADSGYVFDNASSALSIPDFKVSDDKKSITWNLTMPEKDVTINVTFKAATPTVDADETEYTITIVAPHGTVELDKTKAKAGETVKLTKLEADKDYTLKTMSIKKENGEDVTEFDRKNQSFTMPESNVTVTVNFVQMYSLSVNASDLYAITGGGMKEAGKTVTLPITHYDVNTGWGTPKAEELYLVKVHIKEGETELTNIPVTITEDHKIQFTMPEKNINVFAEFCDIRYQLWEEGFEDYKVGVGSEFQNPVTAVLCFNNKAYDNLKEVGGKCVFILGNLSKGEYMCFNETKYGDYKLSKDGTLGDSQYTFGVIVNDELIIHKIDNNDKDFTYSDSDLQSK